MYLRFYDTIIFSDEYYFEDSYHISSDVEKLQSLTFLSLIFQSLFHIVGGITTVNVQKASSGLWITG